MPATDDLIARARRVAEVGGTASAELLLRLAGRVEELEGLLQQVEWEGFIDKYSACPLCTGCMFEGHAPGCRLAAALKGGGVGGG